MTSEKGSSQESRQLMVLLVWLEQNPAVEDEESTAQMVYLTGCLFFFMQPFKSYKKLLELRGA